MTTLKQIIESVPGLVIKGNPLQTIKNLAKLDSSLSEDELCWCSDVNIESLKQLKSGSVICNQTTPETYFQPNCNYILCENPRLVFKLIGDKFFADLKVDYVIEKSAFIDSTSKISPNVKIGHNAVIEANVTIEEGSVIGSNTVIHKNTKIGKNVKIGCNNTIGGVGFGYVKEEDGSYSVINHFGNVVIENDVEIGNNTCIDRAVLGSTLIKKNAKIDNLVHIAHGVEIGENSLVIANAMVAGSVKIGKNSWIAPSASILNKKTIGDNVTIGLGAVVIKDVESNDTVVGNPSKSIIKK